MQGTCGPLSRLRWLPWDPGHSPPVWRPALWGACVRAPPPASERMFAGALRCAAPVAGSRFCARRNHRPELDPHERSHESPASPICRNGLCFPSVVASRLPRSKPAPRRAWIPRAPTPKRAFPSIPSILIPRRRIRGARRADRPGRIHRRGTRVARHSPPSDGRRPARARARPIGRQRAHAGSPARQCLADRAQGLQGGALRDGPRQPAADPLRAQRRSVPG